MVSGIMSISWPDNDMCSKLESEFLTSAFILQKLPLSYLVYTIRLESVVCADGHMSHVVRIRQTFPSWSLKCECTKL